MKERNCSLICPRIGGADGSKPTPGDRVFFRIESLVPDVVLRVLLSGDPLARLSAILPSVPLAQEAVLYVAARDRLDAFLSTSPLWNDRAFSTMSLDARKTSFIDFAARNERALDAFAEALARSRSICRTAASAGLLFFRHLPWLGPGLAQVEVSLWRDGESPIIAGARLASGENLLLRGSMQGKIFRYRVAVEGGGVLPRKFSLGRTAAAEYLGFMPGQGASGGQVLDLVGRILASAADSGSMAVGRFSRKL